MEDNVAVFGPFNSNAIDAAAKNTGIGDQQIHRVPGVKLLEPALHRGPVEDIGHDLSHLGPKCKARFDDIMKSSFITPEQDEPVPLFRVIFS